MTLRVNSPIFCNHMIHNWLSHLRSRRGQLLLAALLGLSFFGFIDDKLRGWNDTNQYMLEAQAWSRGDGLPAKDIVIQDEWEDLHGPVWYPPLTSYVFSLFSDSSPHKTVKNLRILQGFIWYLAFMLFVWALSLTAVKHHALLLGVLVFFTHEVSLYVMNPQSESLTFLIYILAFSIPLISGVAGALMVPVRPMMGPLFFPIAWRNRFQKLFWISFVLSLLSMTLIFGKLIIPDAPKPLFFSWAKSLQIWESFCFYLSLNWFNHIAPIYNPTFQKFFQVGVAAFAAWVFWLTYHRKLIWICFAAFLGFVFMPAPQGLRYFYPGLVYLVLELSRDSKGLFAGLKHRKYLLAIFYIIGVHVLFLHGQTIKDFQKDTNPQANSQGLIKAREWINAQNPRGLLMSYRFRHCSFFFQRPCYGLTMSPDNLLEDLKNKQISFLILQNLAWQKEDNILASKLMTKLESQGPLAIQTFDNVQVIKVPQNF